MAEVATVFELEFALGLALAFGLELGLLGPWLVHDLLRGDVDFLAILTTPVAGRFGSTTSFVLVVVVVFVVVVVVVGLPLTFDRRGIV